MPLLAVRIPGAPTHFFATARRSKSFAVHHSQARRKSDKRPRQSRIEEIADELGITTNVVKWQALANLPDVKRLTFKG
jgi:hypothetical protein